MADDDNTGNANNRIRPNEGLWKTGPAQIPKLIASNDTSATSALDITGTYDVPGCDKLHIIDCTT
jgi:hypothetical protein